MDYARSLAAVEVQGRRVGVYEIERRLGIGGMAETFAAIRRGPGNFEQRVCLKTVLPAYSQDDQFTQLFLDEARLIARMRHSHLVQVYDFGEHDGLYYLALELVDGLDLRGLIQALRETGDGIPPSLVALIAYEVATALDYAHTLEVDETSMGVIHRDVSPSNVLLSRSGEVKLADFGIAKAPLQAHVTQSGAVKGKVPYMSPEQALGQPLDGRSDLFALGVVMYEALTGERPFDGPTDAATLVRIVSGDHTPLAQQMPQAPASLVAVIEKLIQRDPALRYASAAEFLVAMADILPPPTARRELATLVRRCSRHPTMPPLLYSAPIQNADPEAPLLQAPALAPEVAPKTPDAAVSPSRKLQSFGELEVATPHASTETAPEVRDSATLQLQDLLGSHQRRTLRFAMTTAAAIALLAVGYIWLDSSVRPSLRTTSRPPTPSDQRATLNQPQASRTSPKVSSTTSAPSPVPVQDLARQELAPAAEVAAPTTAQPPAIRAAAPLPAALSPSAAATPTTTPGSRSQGSQGGVATPTARAAGAGKAQLQVIALPWGKVWIDGSLIGTSPVRVDLRAGTHRVAVGFESASQQTRVHLVTGEQRELVLRIERPVAGR